MAQFTLYDSTITATVSASAEIISNTDTSATVKVTATGYIPAGYWVYSTGVVVTITINGSSTTQTLFGNGSYYYGSDGAKTQTYSITVAKTKATQSISWSVAFKTAMDGYVQYTEYTASGTQSVSAKTSYTISYNANGGSGAPSAQTKWYNENITLSSSSPTRTGYTFNGWATSSGGSKAYSPGSTYSSNSSVTLYAVWTIKTYAIYFNANGGSGGPSTVYQTHGSPLTLPSTKPTKTNYNFLGWSTSSAGGVVYKAGGSYSENVSRTLYAVWQLAYVKPRINGLSVSRCNASGTAMNSGTYARVSFSWATDRTVSSIKIDWGASSTTVSASGTSGNINTIVGNNQLSIDSTYTFTITVSDSNDYSSVSATLDGMAYAIDFRAGGGGVAIGKPSESNIFDVNMTSTFRKNVSVLGTLTTNGTSSSSDERIKFDFISLDAWDSFYDSIEPIAFKLKTEDSNKYHIGFKAQQIESALVSTGLNTENFAGLIKKKFDPDTVDPANLKVYISSGIKPGDNEYGLIYTEFVALNTFEIQKLKKQVEELKTLVVGLST